MTSSVSSWTNLILAWRFLSSGFYYYSAEPSTYGSGLVLTAIWENKTRRISLNEWIEFELWACKTLDKNAKEELERRTELES